MADSIRFNRATIDALPHPPTGKRAYYQDDSFPKGTRLAITPTGAKSWVVQLRINGRVKRVTLGNYPDMPPGKAKRAAESVRGEVATGADPQAEKRARSVRGLTLGAALEHFMRVRGVNLKPNTRNAYQRDIERDLGDWLDKPFSELTRALIEKRFLKLHDNSPSGAGKTFRTLSTLWNWCYDYYETDEGEPQLPANPLPKLKRLGIARQSKPRTNFIRENQLPDWFQAVERLRAESWNSAEKTAGDALMFLILTGARRMEAFTLRWDDVDLKGARVTFRDTKNGTDHVLPLPNYVNTLLKQRFINRPNTSEYVFWGKNGRKYLVEPRRPIARVIEESGAHFTPHDLRRTFATYADMNAIQLAVNKSLMNHKRGANDVTLNYIQVTEDKQRAAMTKITDYLLSAGRVAATPTPAQHTV